MMYPATNLSTISPMTSLSTPSRIRKRSATELTAKQVQGRAAAGLALHPSKDIASQVAGKGSLYIMDWQPLPRAHLDLLPLRGHCWSNLQSNACRRCGEECENSLHVLNNCKLNLQHYTCWHNIILDLLTALIIRNAPGSGFLPPTRLRHNRHD